MSKPKESRELETELWSVYESVSKVDDEVARAGIQLKALDLMVKIRLAGEKVKPGGEEGLPDVALDQARLKANRGKV